MDFEGLSALLAVAEHGSFQAAARATGVSRTTLRRRVETLESKVGGSLLLRGARGVRLTWAGKRLVDSGREIMSKARRALAEVSGLNNAPAGVLRAIVPSGAPVEVKAGTLRMTSAILPGVRVILTEADDPLRHLDEPFDLMIHFGGPPTRGEFYTRTWRKFQVGLFATHKYLARHGAPRSLADLVDHRLLIWQPALAASGSAFDAAPLQPALVTHNDHLVRTLAADGAGIALSLRPPLPFDPLVSTGVLLLPDAVNAEVAATLLMPVHTRDEPLVRTLIDQLSGLTAA